MNEENNIDRKEITREIAHIQFLSYGTIQIFEKRANTLRTLRSWLTFLGIVLPVTVGGVFISFGQSQDLMKVIVLVASVIGILQLILSTWALVAGWDSSYESAIKSVQGNTAIYNKCKRFISCHLIRTVISLMHIKNFQKKMKRKSLLI
ncbi:mobilome CxxCx(11)CxxC protein [Plesiomonas sp. ZOR0011]|uniref:mobilome CxxCx(11)CxxC protein n=1 Tax=Plesiomonas sp. ZOR0011 TaxID=1339230 RepID=UPI000649030C|nr:mobilome CxxCx(11)CxxC protein [Plesiomonas sp. ZOR0011]